MFRRGLWVNLLNPKALVFFLAFMPQFIRPEQPLLPQYVVLTVTVVAIDIVVICVLLRCGRRIVPVVSVALLPALTLSDSLFPGTTR